MILRFLGAILLGGGAIGSFTGWMLCKYLDARQDARRLLAERRKSGDLSHTGTWTTGSLPIPPEPPSPPLAPGKSTLNFSRPFTPSPYTGLTQDEVARDPQVIQWLAQQREQKMQQAAELMRRQLEEEERRKRDGGS